MAFIERKEGVVVAADCAGSGACEILVECDGRQVKAVVYPELTGDVRKGERVLLNVTAVSLALGSGGRHFVMANLSRPLAGMDAQNGCYDPKGHIMKLRYTPMQCGVQSAGEEGSPWRDALESFVSLDGTPVVIGQLHSMVAPVCAALGMLSDGKLRVAYVMSDGGSLSVTFSRTVEGLRKRNLVEGVVSCGHCFGGDVEVLNKYSALAVARVGLKADVIVVAMGVGVAGTGTTLDNTAIEAGEWVNAARALGGEPVFIPRISFADGRDRHRGISHHTATALNVAARERAVVAVPELPGEQAALVDGDISKYDIARRHDIRKAAGECAVDGMKKYDLRVTTMGRGVEDDRAFFLACGAAARVAFEIASCHT